ncbi:tyrosine-protein phosphatase non-receptor type 2-like isoform X2 [Cimex lectularius]|uniref:protein-tyrosine-phosphatase n=1 Tax=Cimex lectularius TaxID=79782 RepID=A0A8I6TIK7_CIMLE|nr:tyrosine-protein phosphatase non-receptor type 2-like isoform X2 [Cimex lectularius]
MGTDNPKTNVENEFNEIDRSDGWIQLYLEIKVESSKYDFSTSAAIKKKNAAFNRYRDVNPYDHSRIVLQRGTCDYINANLVKVPKANRKYILTQGPLQRTVGHFWLMVWEQKSRGIVMLNRILENNQKKCHLYWPRGEKAHGENVLTLTDVGLSVTFVSFDDKNAYPKTILRLTDLESGESREVIHFQYTMWPDFGVPESARCFVRFLCLVRRSGILEEDSGGPPVVHCSAGIGRSGTFCLVDSCLILMKKLGQKDVNIKELLLEMRSDRMGLIQTPGQLRFSYLAVIEELTMDWESQKEFECLPEEESAWKNTISESDSESDDEPPPLPPPRSDSKREIPPSPPHDLPLPPDRPLPSEPPTPETPTPENELSNNDASMHYNDLGEGLRERKRVEANKKTSDIISEMKRKQEAAESWQRVKRKHTEDSDEGENPPTKKS